MTAEGWLTLAVLAALVTGLARGRVAPAVGIMAAAIVLLLTGVIDASAAFSGFSSTAVITVAALFVVAGAVEQTGVLTQMVARVVQPGRPRLLRLLVPVAASSSLMNNTPIVAAMAPALMQAARRAGVPASRYLMPLSYATILGGIVTTIGTSTNLVVSGLLAERGMDGLPLLAMTPVGLPVAVVGIGLISVTASRLLPERIAPQTQVLRDPRRYAVELRVVPGGPLDGVVVGDGGLRDLQDGYLAARRDDGILHPLAARDTLRGGDVLSVVGDVESVLRALGDGGLDHQSADDLVLSGDRSVLAEVVVDAGSDLVGSTLKEVGFRSRHGSVVMAVHRAGVPLHGKLGSLRLRAGDALLLLGGPGTLQGLQRSNDFSVVAPLQAQPRTDGRRRWLTLVIAGVMVITSAVGLVDILHAALAAVLALLATGSISTERARRAIDLDVLIVIAGSFALGAAVEGSGLAARIAEGAVLAADRGGRAAGVLAIVVLTMALTEPLSNAAAAALMLPVALDVAGQMGGDPQVFAVAVAVAASASFLTPIGYQTNTMVFGLGGYHFGDYARLGAPVTAVTLVVVTVMVLLLAF